jgi:transposase
VLLTDGYTAYEHYTTEDRADPCPVLGAHRRVCSRRKTSNRRHRGARAGLLIGGLYAVEDRIRDRKLSAAKKLDYRLTHAKPLVERFFAWVNQQFEAQGLLPSNPMTKALAYARERRFGLEVYLTDPDVPIDTNHLERALRAIPMGRKNWMFCWTELGAKHVGIMQSLIVTCRLHGSIPTTIWSMCCSASASIRPAGSKNSRRDCGSNSSPTIRCDRHCIAFASEAGGATAGIRWLHGSL